MTKKEKRKELLKKVSIKRLHIRDFVYASDTLAPVDIYVRMPKNRRYILWVAQGDEFPKDKMDRLAGHKDPYVYVVESQMFWGETPGRIHYEEVPHVDQTAFEEIPGDLKNLGDRAGKEKTAEPLLNPGENRPGYPFNTQDTELSKEEAQSATSSILAQAAGLQTRQPLGADKAAGAQSHQASTFEKEAGTRSHQASTLEKAADSRSRQASTADRETDPQSHETPILEKTAGIQSHQAAALESSRGSQSQTASTERSGSYSHQTPEAEKPGPRSHQGPPSETPGPHVHLGPPTEKGQGNFFSLPSFKDDNRGGSHTDTKSVESRLWGLYTPLLRKEVDVSLEDLAQIGDSVVALISPEAQKLKRMISGDSRYQYLLKDSAAIYGIATLFFMSNGYTLRGILEDLAFAVLFMDLPLVEFTEDIYKQGIINYKALSENDKPNFRSHPSAAHKAAREKLKKVSTNCLRMIEGHHEWANGEGYPRSMRSENLPPLVRILAYAVLVFEDMKKAHYEGKAATFHGAVQDAAESDKPAKSRRAHAMTAQSVLTFLKHKADEAASSGTPPKAA